MLGQYFMKKLLIVIKLLLLDYNETVDFSSLIKIEMTLLDFGGIKLNFDVIDFGKQ